MTKSATGSAARLPDAVRNRLAETVRELWIYLQKCQHAADIFPSEVTGRLSTVLGSGIFDWPRSAKARSRRPISAKGEDTLRRLLEEIDSESHSAVTAKVLATVTLLVESLTEVRKIAMQLRIREPAKSKSLWTSYFVIRRALFKLLGSKILADMPNTPRITEKDEPMLVKLAAALAHNFTVIDRAARSSSQREDVKTLLGRASGLSLFRAVRAQETGAAPVGPQGLVEWMKRDLPGFQRGFLSQLGLGIQELADIAELLESIRDRQTKPDSPERKQVGTALDIISITIYQVVGTGILRCFPA